MNFDAMAQYLPLYEDAAWLTLSIGWIGIAGSVIIGLVVAMIVHFRIPVLRQLCRVYIELFRNTPLLIQLFFFYFGLPRMGLRYGWPCIARRRLHGRIVPCWPGKRGAHPA